MKKLAVVLASLLLAACASSPKIDSAKVLPSNDTNKTADTNTNQPSQSSVTAQTSPLAAHKSIYFDYDSSKIADAYRNVLIQEADYLKQHKETIFVLEGNADERGSAEYNFSLGDKRASAVQKNLELLGVPASQLKVVSFGNQKPKLLCHEEKCWHENRRVDFN